MKESPIFIDFLQLFITSTKQLTYERLYEFAKYLPPISESYFWKINQNGIKIFFTGSYWKHQTAEENLTEIPLLYTPDLYNILGKCCFISISRLDLSKNIYSNFKNFKFDIYSFSNPMIDNLKQHYFEYYNFHNGEKIYNGFSLGRSSPDSVRLSVYSKADDTYTGRLHAINRFGTCEFIRYEFNIGHKILKDLGCPHLENLLNFKQNDFIKLFSKMEQRKSIIYDGKTKPIRTRTKRPPKIKADFYYRETVESIISNYYSEEEKKILLEKLKGNIL